MSESVIPEISAELRRRIEMTVSCRDSDALAKVPGAGEVCKLGDRSVQRMHNGLLIVEGCYYGPWMTEIISRLHGHHEPQEELAFAAVLDLLGKSMAEGRHPVSVEFGSFWAYYSMWFLQRFAHGRAICVEPDLAYLQVGRENFALNGLSGEFVRAAVGGEPGRQLDFQQESDGLMVQVAQHDLDSLLAERGVEQLDLLLVDVQGAETVLIERAAESLAAGRVRYLVLSTHHHSISGDPLTHQRIVSRLRETGCRILAEHSVSESYSGDGLVVVTWEPADAQTPELPISRARAVESLFGELEYDLAATSQALTESRQRLTEVEAEFARAVAAHDNAVGYAAALAEQLTALQEQTPAAGGFPPAPAQRSAAAN